MADRSAIEWTDATWNPLRAAFPPDRWVCRKISSGCDNCYASTLNRRFGGSEYEPVSQNQPRAQLDYKAVCLPGHWRRPRRVFVCSMTDLFGEWVPWGWMWTVFDAMRASPQHQFQVLTKRPQRMQHFVAKEWIGAGFDLLPNVWLGVSIEEDRYTWRAEALKQIPAAVRFVSAEPLLGPLPRLDTHGIDWLIVGGESGARHRPLEADWVRQLRDSRCASTAFFFKQWGGRTHAEGGRLLDGRTWDEFPQEKVPA